MDYRHNTDSINSLIEHLDAISEETMKVVENFNSMVLPIFDQLNDINFTKYTQPLIDFAIHLQQARENPYSTLNWLHYQDELNKYYWVWPYDIDAHRMKEIIENVENEKQFDEAMKKYYRKEVVEDMMNDIFIMLPNNRKTIFKQVMHSYRSRYYSIANLALFSIIDHQLSFLHKKDNQTMRKNILKPIVDFYFSLSVDETYFNIFELVMLSGCINFIFQSVNIHKEKMQSNKKTNRHLSQHGVNYSNKKLDSLLLLSCLYSLLKLKPYLHPFRGTIIYSENKKCLKITESKLPLIKRRIKRLKKNVGRNK